MLQRFNKIEVGEIGVSSITVAELEFGAQKSQFPEKNHQALAQFLLPLLILDFDNPAAVVYGNIRAKLEKQGKPIGALDTFIAAHALSLEATLITNNLKEFERVPNLKLENWVN